MRAPEPQFTTSDLFDLLKEDGWSVKRDPDDGSRSATRVEGDRVFRIFPTVRNTSDGRCISWGESVIPTRYLDAVSLIKGKSFRFYPLKPQSGTRLTRKNLDRETVRKELDITLENLRIRDLTASLDEIANLPLSSPGNAPIRLLAAKACKGDHSDLCEMRDKMISGDRQGFVPYIETEHLERAVNACIQLNEDLI